MGHPEHQLFQIGVDPWMSDRRAMRGAIKLLGHQCAMPRQNGVGFDDAGDFIERLFAQLLADRSQCYAFRVGELDAARALVT